MAIPSKMPHGGLGKLSEESGEVVQVIGKYMTLGHLGEHWDGTNLKIRLEEELADLSAAANFVIEKHGLDKAHITRRYLRKVALFAKWDAENPDA